MSERTAYLVSCGEYSDYRVVGVFSTREKAETYRNWRNGPDGSECDVEEWPMDVEPDRNRGAFRVCVDTRGTVQFHEWQHDKDPTTPPCRGTGELCLNPDPARFTGYGPTVEHARRSAEEYRRAVLTGNIV